MEDKIVQQIKAHIKEAESKMEDKSKHKKKQILCARCHKPKRTRKHHWPLGSLRLVPLCNHCYTTVKKQRNRRSRYYGTSL